MQSAHAADILLAGIMLVLNVMLTNLLTVVYEPTPELHSYSAVLCSTAVCSSTALYCVVQCCAVSKADASAPAVAYQSHQGGWQNSGPAMLQCSTGTCVSQVLSASVNAGQLQVAAACNTSCCSSGQQLQHCMTSSRLPGISSHAIALGGKTNFTISIMQHV